MASGEWVTAGILGVVEGLTEFLPISSTGHLILAGHLAEFHSEKAESFEIFIQLGAILAVVLLFPHRFRDFLRVNRDAPGFSGLHGVLKLGCSAAPALFLGVLFGDKIKDVLFVPFWVAVAFIVGAVIMIVVELAKPKPRIPALEHLSYLHCFAIGLFQCFALWPGMSRSGSVIVGAMLTGLPRKDAAEFSFLAGVPVIAAASLYSLLREYSSLTSHDLGIFAFGLVISFVTAIVGIKVCVTILQRYSLIPFAVYRIAVGVLIISVF